MSDQDKKTIVNNTRTVDKEKVGWIRYFFSLGETNPITAILVILLLVIFALVIQSKMKDTINENTMAVVSIQQSVGSLSKRLEETRNQKLNQPMREIIALPSPGYSPLGHLFGVVNLQAVKTDSGMDVTGEILNPTSLTFTDLVFTVGEGDGVVIGIKLLRPGESQEFKAHFAKLDAVPKKITLTFNSTEIIYNYPTTTRWEGD